MRHHRDSFACNKGLNVSSIEAKTRSASDQLEGFCWWWKLIPIVVSLERTVLGNAEVLGLFLRKTSQLHAELAEMQARHLLVELLGQHVHADGILVRLVPQCRK